MFNRRLALTLIFCGLLGGSAANAEEPRCYTAASVQGSWGVVVTYGANVAKALVKRDLEENGGLFGTFVLNGPTPGSTTGARTITTGTNVGSYAVNCDGSGTFIRIVTASNGTTASQVDDFIITAAIVRGGKLIATALADVQRTPSALVPGGIFVTRVHTRLPENRDER
jgi:hypothetical protein